MMVFLSTYFFTTSYSQALGFKSYVSDQIKREGGLTNSAMSNINKYCSEQYKSKFTVVSDSGSGKQPYGTVVNYHIQGNIGGNMFNLPAVFIKVYGSGVSMVR